MMPAIFVRSPTRPVRRVRAAEPIELFEQALDALPANVDGIQRKARRRDTDSVDGHTCSFRGNCAELTRHAP